MLEPVDRSSRRNAVWRWDAVIDSRHSSPATITSATAFIALILATVLAVLLGLLTPHAQADDAPGTSYSSASAGPLNSDSVAASVASVQDGGPQRSCRDCQPHCPGGESCTSCPPASTPALMKFPLPRQPELNDIGPVDRTAGTLQSSFAPQQARLVSLIELSISRI